jgi:predicted lipoprotein with Yx(FWY)xxD motif
MRMKHLFVASVIAVAAGSLLAGALAQASRQNAATTSKVVISTRVVPKLGRILVDSKGLTLYMFVPDKQKRVTCKGVCAKIWPPIKVGAGAKLVAAGGVEAKLLGSDANPAGGRVATYNGWPLYLYAGDKKPGAATGQALNLNGGLWYVLSSSGNVIKTKVLAPTAETTTTGTTTTPSTTPVTTTTPTAGGDGCPSGVSIPTSGNTDNDGDENGDPSDGDGCV